MFTGLTLSSSQKSLPCPLFYPVRRVAVSYCLTIYSVSAALRSGAAAAADELNEIDS